MGRNIAKTLTSLLWIAAGIAIAQAGTPLALLAVAAYLVYLWAFDGNMLIY